MTTYQIYASRELAVRMNKANLESGSGVIITAAQRNPARYPSTVISAEPFAALSAIAHEGMREALRGLLLSTAQSILAQAVKDGASAIGAQLFSLDNLLATASETAGGRLSKDSYAKEFEASALGRRMQEVAKSKPATAKQLRDWVIACATPRGAAKLSDSNLAQLLTVLGKPEYEADAQSAWREQCLQSIERAQSAQQGADLGDVF